MKDVIQKGSLLDKASEVDKINAVGSMSRILEEMKQAEKSKTITSASSIDIKESSTDPVKPKNAAHYSTGLQAYSFTSMAFTPTTKAVAANISDQEVMFRAVQEKGQIQLKTNLGDMHIELVFRYTLTL